MYRELKLSPEGQQFIQHFEGCRLEAYKDGEHYSIGFGHNGPDVFKGMKITRSKAKAFFLKDIEWVESTINEYVNVPMLQQEFDALCSLVYNIGGPQFEESSLLRRLNQGERIPAADHFLRWNKEKGKVSPGLVKRRAAEKHLFLGFPYETALKKGDEAHGIYIKGLSAPGA